jgi:hypothetical protein
MLCIRKVLRGDSGGEVVSVEIKLVDWAAAHCLEEGQFSPKGEERRRAFLRRAPTFGVSHDLQYVHALLEEMVPVPGMEQLWAGLAAKEKTQMEESYRSLLFHLFRLQV